MALAKEMDFPAFPYGKPYAIQQQFMSKLYKALEHGQIGLFESPTGGLLHDG
jgi:Rad3-related DNA helicase